VLIRIFTRQGCPLCDAGIDLVRKVFAPVDIELIDVDLDLALLERYGDRVPVIEDSDGMIIDEGIVSEAVLRDYAPDSVPLLRGTSDEPCEE
jgi:hypothetical protein